MINNYILNIKNVTAGYESNFFIKDISFDIKKGDFVGIIGPNGSGKTTLFKTITKILPAKSGEILLNNRNISNMNFKEIAQNTAVVSQNIENQNIKIRDYVLLGRVPYFKNLQFFETKKDIEIAEYYMELTDVLKLKNKFLHSVSSGEKQLVSIAKALSQEPLLLLLDEPVAHLDIKHQIIILDLLKRLNKKLQLTIIIILHDLNLAAKYCDKLFLMNQGRIHQSGIPEDVLTYKTIEEVYNTIVVIEKDSISSKPMIVLVSEEELNYFKSKFKK